MMTFWFGFVIVLVDALNDLHARQESRIRPSHQDVNKNCKKKSKYY